MKTQRTRSETKSAALLGSALMAAATLVPFAQSVSSAEPKTLSGSQQLKLASNLSANKPLGKELSNEEMLHFLNRTSYGAAPGDLAKLKKLGVEAYLNAQLEPEKIQIPENLKALDKYDALSMSPARLFLNYGKPALQAIAQKGGSEKPEDKKQFQKMLHDTYQRLYEQTSTARIRRAVESPAQLRELMVDFWYNHFNISIDKNLDHVWVGSFEEKAIRPHALGRFRDLLGATAHHAAMLFYLDNWQNTAAKPELALSRGAAARKGKFKGINENYARELMELHTLGVDGGYTQKDVQELARVLTGLGLPPGAGGGFGLANKQARLSLAENSQMQMTPQQFGQFRQARQFGQAGQAGQFARRRAQGIFQAQAQAGPAVNLDDPLGSYFDSGRHDFSDKLIVGYRIKGSGEGEIDEVLDILAKHPSTAKHLSYKLAQYFVCDKPPAPLVEKLSKTYLETDGDIKEVLSTLFHAPEFWDKQAMNAKFKSPYRYLISSLRSTNGQMERIQPPLAFLTQLGMPLYKCLTPDGYKNTKEAWLNPDNLINRLSFATAYGVGRYPGLRPGHNDAAELADCIGPSLSDKTVDAVMNAPEQMRIALLLGSPEFMKY